jgi:hypothetical protein
MSQRYARVPFLLCKFHAHACSNPGRLCQRYAPVLYLLCIFHTMAAAAIAELLLAAGLVWLQCDHRVLSNPRVLVQSKGDIAARCPGTGSTWHKSCLTLHTCLLHTLVAASLFCCSMGTGFAQQHTAHTECGAILIQQYQGVQAHCACSMWCKGHAVPHARLQQAAASLCSLVCDCYRVLTTAQGCSSRADQHNPAQRPGEVWARCTYLTPVCHALGTMHACCQHLLASPTCTALLMLAH